MTLDRHNRINRINCDNCLPLPEGERVGERA